MAKKAKTGPLLATLVMFAAAAGGGFWVWRGAAKVEAQAPPAEPPALPDGRLQLLRAGVSDASYLALDEIRTVPDRTAVVVLTVAKNPSGLQGGAGLLVEAKQVRCAPQRLFDGAAAYYSAEGELIGARTFATPRHGRPANPEELQLLKHVCEAKAAAPVVLDGFRAAQRESQSTPEGYEKALSGRPHDAHGWAWMCAEGARRGWREASHEDCDRAVRLNPASGQVRLDRAYLSLMTGRTAKARADFDAVLAHEPENPRALFGRGVVRAMAGEAEAGRLDRRRAAQLDPEILRWVEVTYRYTVLTPYRST